MSFTKVMYSIGIGLVLGAAQRAEACTAFCSNSEKNGPVLMAKSYDWNVEKGAVVVNQAGMSKTALTLDKRLSAAKWTSDFGSITFNQHGRELPVGGINTEGLAIEALWLSESKYEALDARPTVNELQWIQYQLDERKTVREVIDHLDEVRIQHVHAPIHYFGCDASGACATVEFLKGKAVVHETGKDLPYRVLANTSIDESLNFVNEGNFSGISGKEVLPIGFRSLPRYTRTVANAEKYTSGRIQSVEGAFDMLMPVFVDATLPGVTETQWNIVYNLTDRAAHFLTRSARERKSVKLEGFEFDCHKQPEVLTASMQIQKGGELTPDQFVPFTREINRSLIDTAYADLPLPAEVLAQAVLYPEVMTRCE